MQKRITKCVQFSEVVFEKNTHINTTFYVLQLTALRIPVVTVSVPSILFLFCVHSLNFPSFKYIAFCTHLQFKTKNLYTHSPFICRRICNSKCYLLSTRNNFNKHQSLLNAVTYSKMCVQRIEVKDFKSLGWKYCMIEISNRSNKKADIFTVPDVFVKLLP